MFGLNSTVDIIMIIFAVVITLSYTFRGFLKSVIQLFKTVMAFLLAYWFGGRAGDLLCRRFIGTAVRNFVFDKVNGVYGGTVESVNLDTISSKLPSFMLTEQVKNEIAAAQGSGEQLINSITDSIATPAANTISGIVGYVLVFLVSLIVLSFLACFLTKLIERITLFKVANMLLGALFGALVAFLILCVFSSVIKALMGETDFYLSSKLMKFLGDSAFLEKIKFLDVCRVIGVK